MAELIIPGRARMAALGLGGGGAVPGSVAATYNYVTLVGGNPDTQVVTDGALLRSAYATAKALHPAAGDLSAGNRACVLIPPGLYQADAEFLMDAEFVDLIGLTGDPKDVVLLLTQSDDFSGAVKQSANDVRFKGLTFMSEQARDVGAASEKAAWFPTGTHSATVFTDCIFTDGGFLNPVGTGWCMRQSTSITATFINCVSGDYSYGAHTSGHFAGTARDCVGGINSFGGSGGNFSGTAYDCTGGDRSFGSGGAFSGLLVRPIMASWTHAWNPSGGFTGRVSRARFAPTGSNLDAVNIPESSTGTFEYCTFKSTGFGTDINTSFSSVACNPTLALCDFDPWNVAANVVPVLRGSVIGNLSVGGFGSVIGKVLTATAALDFPDTAAGVASDLTIAVTGAAVGDTVHLGLPAAPNTNFVFEAFVSASDVVKVRAHNVSSGSVNPASATYRVTVMHFVDP